MSRRKLILIVAFVLGLISGPSMLFSARTTVPPTEWNSIPFVLVGSVIGIVFLIGIQLARKNPNPVKFIIRVFEAISTAMLGSGASAFAMSIINYSMVASGVFIAAWGIGLAVGVTLSSMLFHWRHRNVIIK